MAIATTIQPASADTFIVNVTPTTNYGTNALLAVGDSSASANAAYRTLVKFSLTGIPSNAVVTAASLSLLEYAAYDTASAGSWSVSLYPLLRNWVQAEATWNVYSSGNNWSTAGASGAGDVGAAVDSITLDGTAAAAFVAWSGSGLVSLVQSWISGATQNYGVAIAALSAENKGVAPMAANLFRSTDYGTAGERPKLSIEYVLGRSLVNSGLMQSQQIAGGTTQ